MLLMTKLSVAVNTTRRMNDDNLNLISTAFGRNDMDGEQERRDLVCVCVCVFVCVCAFIMAFIE